MRQHELSVSQRKLLILMEKVSYGRINNLEIRKGEPIISPESTIMRDMKPGADDSHIVPDDDFVLKKKVTDFFEQLIEIKEGFIRKIEIRGGLPILMQIEENITV